MKSSVAKCFFVIFFFLTAIFLTSKLAFAVPECRTLLSPAGGYNENARWCIGSSPGDPDIMTCKAVAGGGYQSVYGFCQANGTITAGPTGDGQCIDIIDTSVPPAPPVPGNVNSADSASHCLQPASATACLISQVSGVEPHYLNGSIVNPALNLDIGKSICLPGFENVVARCENETGIGFSSFTYCDTGCSEVGGSAKCNTILPTSTPGPTPTVAVGKTCDHPAILNGADYNPNSSLCIRRQGTLHATVFTCTETATGSDWVEGAECNYSDCYETGSVPFTRAECVNTYVAPTPNPLCLADLSVGQRWSALGQNCGVPIEDDVPESITIDGTNYFTVYIKKEDHPIHLCCYSHLAVLNIPPSCYIGTGFPGADTLIDWIGTSIISIIDRAPMFWDNGPGAFNIRNLRRVATDLEPCRNGSAPRDGKKANEPGCTCVRNSGPVEFCDNMSSSDETDKCTQCVKPTSEGGGGGIWTGIGCIPVESEGGFVQSLLGLGVSLGGGMSLLCLMYAAFLFQTSRGSPEPLKKARDLITSCLTGLLLIIFAVFILNLVGYTILRIPGFGGP